MDTKNTEKLWKVAHYITAPYTDPKTKMVRGRRKVSVIKYGMNYKDAKALAHSRRGAWISPDVSTHTQPSEEEIIAQAIEENKKAEESNVVTDEAAKLTDTVINAVEEIQHEGE